MDNYDIILVNMPVNEEDALTLPIFLLKSCVEQNGFSCRTYDLNKEVRNYYLDQNLPFYVELASPAKFYDHYDKILKPYFLRWVNDIKKFNPKWIGISVTTNETVLPTTILVRLIKKHMPDTKIVLGGALFAPYLDNSEQIYILFDSLKNYGVDVFIYGDGENAIVELLKGNTNFPGINLAKDNHHADNSFTIADPVDIDLTPPPDYSDMDTNDPYEVYYVYTSRGCYNKCLFCFEPLLYTYKYRSAENIIKDMDALPYSNKNFYFADNLMNGNPKEFKKLIDGLIGKDYNWGGMYVCNSWMEDEDYKMAYNAGMSFMNIGIESGCERVRAEMGKSFNSDDIIKTISLCAKNNIYVVLLNIIGWLTETDQEFQENLDFIKTLLSYGNVAQIYASELYINSKQSLYQMYDFHLDKNFDWVYKKNNKETRLNRMNRLEQFSLNNYIPFIKRLN